LSDLNYFLIFL